VPRKSRITTNKVLALLVEHGAQTSLELAMRLGHGREGVEAVDQVLADLKRTHRIGWVGEVVPEVWQIED
jgi:hypothetical protein